MRAFAVAAALSVVLARSAFAQVPPSAAPAAPAAAPRHAPLLPPRRRQPGAVPDRRQVRVRQHPARRRRVGRRASRSACACRRSTRRRSPSCNAKNKAAAGARSRSSSQGGSVLSDAARGAARRRTSTGSRREIQRFTEDAQKRCARAAERSCRRVPAASSCRSSSRSRSEKRLEILFSAADGGIVWADPGLDLTSEVIRARHRRRRLRRLPAAAPRAAAPAPAAPARRAACSSAVATSRGTGRAGAGDRNTGSVSIDLPALLDRVHHRYPSFLVDAVAEHEPGRRLVAGQERHRQRGVLPGAFPRHAAHARRADDRVADAGGDAC